MKLFGLYSISNTPRLKANHRLFAESNGMEYVEYAARTFYEKWALVEWLLESNPDETCLFIDAFSYFVSLEFDIDMQEPILIQEINGKVMDNFFVVRSCPASRKVFSEVRRRSAHRFTSDNSFLFDVPLPMGTAKPYGFVTKSGRRFNLDLVYTDRGEYFRTCDLPVGIGHPDCSSSDSKSGPGPRTDILVACYGRQGWPCQLTTMAEILCAHRFVVHSPAASEILEVVNPGRPRAILTLSCSESGMPPPEYAAVSELNVRKYAAARDVTLYLYKGIPAEYEGLHSTWTKPYLVLRHLHSHERLAWIDGDVLLSKDFLLPEGNDVVVYNDPGAWLFNAGFITFRQSKQTSEYLRAVIARCEKIDDKSSLYVSGSDQTQFIEEFQTFFPDQVPRSNLAANIPVVLNPIRPPGPGLWHFMGINPPSIRAVVMDYYDKYVVNASGENVPRMMLDAAGTTKPDLHGEAGKVFRPEEIAQNFESTPSDGYVIALCADRAFFPYASVTILSLLQKGGCAHVPIFLFSEKFEKEDIAKFDSLRSATRGRLHLVELGKETLKDVASVRHMSRATYARLWVPDILRQCKRVLYLDCDTLVMGDLRDVFEMPMGSNCLAAVRDPVAARFGKMDVFRSGQKAYFNAGVMLIDTARWLREKISEKVMALANDKSERERISAFADQCLLNHVLQGEFAELGKEYNWLTFEPRMANAEVHRLAPLPTKKENAKVLHFAGQIKPWMAESSLEEIWGLYKSMASPSPWRSELVAKRSPDVVISPDRAAVPKVKTVPRAPASRRWDYISPNLVRVFPDEAFPQMVIGDVDSCGWPYLRKEIPHNWYIDRRMREIGFATRDEAAILFNTALDFAGKKCLEIGCWMGWSAAHILMAGTELDIIDPVFANAVNAESVRSSLAWAAKRSPRGAKAVTHAGYSPAKLAEIASAQARKWDFAFIDGDHEGDGPLRDAQECEKHLEDNAIVLFHDLSSPFVAKGLDHFRDRGWNTRIYNTMQIMGVAWRGNVAPVDHQPDPQVQWFIPEHLGGYEVSDCSFDADTAEFERLYRVVKPFTMVGRERLLSLYQNALRILRENIPGDFVECGACRGGSSVLLAYVAKTHSRIPRKVYACDTFEGMPEPGVSDLHKGMTAAQCGFPAGSLRAPLETGLMEIARRAGVLDTIVPVKGLFRDTLPALAGKTGPVSLLHADGDWYESTMDIFSNLFEKVPVGGYVQIDDYGHWEGCRKAVEDYQTAKGVRFSLEQIDDTGFGFRRS